MRYFTLLLFFPPNNNINNEQRGGGGGALSDFFFFSPFPVQQTASGIGHRECEKQQSAIRYFLMCDDQKECRILIDPW